LAEGSPGRCLLRGTFTVAIIEVNLNDILYLRPVQGGKKGGVNATLLEVRTDQDRKHKITVKKTHEESGMGRSTEGVCVSLKGEEKE